MAYLSSLFAVASFSMQLKAQNAQDGDRDDSGDGCQCGWATEDNEDGADEEQKEDGEYKLVVNEESRLVV